MNVYVYSKDGCPFCSLLKSELRKRRITFTEFDLSDDEVRSEFYVNTGTKTVPQLFLSASKCDLTQPRGEHIGGWTEVNKAWERIEKARNP